MLRSTASRLRAALPAAFAAAAFVASGSLASAAPKPAANADPIGVEIDRWLTEIRTAKPADDEAKGLWESSTPLLEQADKALADGKRWFALSRLAYVWPNLAAVDYRSGLAGDLQKQMSGLESELARIGPRLTAAKAGTGVPTFEGAPAVARGFGEASLSEAAGHFDASLDYGRATAAEYGLFYLGTAQGDLEVARFVAGLRDPESAARKPLEPRAIPIEIAAAQDELIAAYKPPAAVDNHSVFIRISALLKQAEELDLAGKRYGAVLKLLDAKMRIGRMLHPERKLSSAETARRAWAMEPKLAATGVDSTLADLYIEIAETVAGDPDPAMAGGETAAAVFEDVLPLYFSLLGPAPPAPPEQRAEATVTLIRWPYT